MNTLLIESNRNIADSIQEIDNTLPDADGSLKTSSVAKWNTIVSDCGIELKQGDRISLESAMLNIPLIEENVIQFLGSTTKTDVNGTARKDNIMDIEIAYYTTNNIQNNFPLPSGKCSIDVNPVFQGSFGAPCFTGQNIWRTSNLDLNYYDNEGNNPPIQKTAEEIVAQQRTEFIFYNADGEVNTGDPLLQPFRFHSTIDSFYSSLFQMKANECGYFFSDVDNENFKFKQFDAADPTNPTIFQSEQAYVSRLNDCAGFQSFTQQVPFYSMNGVQFGASFQAPAPVFNSPGELQVTPVVTTSSTLNMNTDVGDGNYPNNTGSGFYSTELNGGANPLLLVQNFYAATPNSLTSGFSPNGYMPKNFYDIGGVILNDLVRDSSTYRSKFVPETPLYKGSYYNHNPNSRRLYHPVINDISFMNCGPYYDYETNNLIVDLPAGLATTANGYVDFSLPNQNRNNRFFNLLTNTLKLNVPTGNIIPSRLAEIITENLNTINENEDEFFPQKVYIPELQANRSDTKGGWSSKDFKSVISKTCVSFPTLQGACYNAQQTITTDNELDGWDALDKNSISLETEVMSNNQATLHIGKGYKSKQAKFHYWSKMLCGNFEEWKGVTKILPLIMYQPITNDEMNTIVNFNYKHYSVFSGEEKIEPGPTIGNKLLNAYNGRQKQGISIPGIVTNGNRGCFPTLFSNTPSRSSSIASQAIQGLGAILEGGSNQTLELGSISGDRDYTMMYRKYGKMDTIAEAKQFECLNYIQGDIIPTTIIFGGQVKMTDWEEFGKNISLHIQGNSENNFLSQSDEFYNNTLVEWIIGRVNDQNSFPEQYINDKYTDGMNNEGIKGYVEYLPNIFLANYYYKNNPQRGFNSSNVNVQSLDSVLQNSSMQTPTSRSVQKTYRTSPLRMGIFDPNNNSYTSEFNPNAFFQKGTIGPDDYIYKFGLPTYTQFKSEYTGDNPYKNVCNRKIRAYRYLPQGTDNYSAYNLYNNPQLFTLGQHDDTFHFSTKPSIYSFEEYLNIYNEMAVLNGGKGLGIVPIFVESAEPHITIPDNLYKIPFCGVIYHSQEIADIPRPAEGEFFMMGSSPSLMQNDLHLPATTQQRFETEYKAGFNGIQINYKNTGHGAFDFPDNNKKLELQENQEPASYAPSILTGAINPKIEYDTTSQRFEITQLHTPYFKSSGVYQQSVAGGNSDANNAEIHVGSKNSGFSKQLTLPAGYLGYCQNNKTIWDGIVSTSNANLQDQTYFLDYQELIENNSIMDYYNPGGAANDITSYDSEKVDKNFSASDRGLKFRCYGTSMQPPSTQFNARYLTLPNTFVAGNYFNNKNPPVGGNNNAIGPDRRSPSYPSGHSSGNQIPTSKFNFSRPIAQTCRAYSDIIQSREPFPTISSQSGIGIISLSIPKTDGTISKITAENYSDYDGGLLDKMGFILNQILPLFGQPSNELIRSNFNEVVLPNTDAGLMYKNMVKPLTTNGIIGSVITNSLVSAFSSEPGTSAPPITAPVNVNIPFFQNNMIIAQGSTNSESEAIYAKNIPDKSEFPYLTCRSSIQTPSGLQYIGGSNGKQLLPVISYLMTNYNNGDFNFITRSDLEFIVNRSYTLTDITTSIHLPNGKLADGILGQNSAIIYRIDFAERTEEEQKKLDEATAKYFKKD